MNKHVGNIAPIEAGTSRPDPVLPSVRHFASASKWNETLVKMAMANADGILSEPLSARAPADVIEYAESFRDEIASAHDAFNASTAVVGLRRRRRSHSVRERLVVGDFNALTEKLNAGAEIDGR